MQPSFCTIAPSSYLTKYARYLGSNYHLLLAHLIDEKSSHFNREYRDFYKNTKQPGEVYIMDNGAFELGRSYEPTRLIELGKQVNADILVLPDYPFQNWQVTRDAAEEYIPLFKQEGFKTFYVPQSETGKWDDWYTGFIHALEHTEIDVIGMSILGIPNALPNLPKGYVRVVAADRIVRDMTVEQAQKFEEKHIHWLGLLSPGLELPGLLSLNVVDTLDSSNPVWFGHCGHQYQTTCETWTPVEKLWVPEVDFGTKANKHADSIIQTNLDRIGQVFNSFYNSTKC